MLTDSRIELRELTVNTFGMTLGGEIRRARERLQMTQPELAELVGVSVDTISNWERGKVQPKNRLARIRQVLHMDEPNLLTTAAANGDDTPGPRLREASHLELLAEFARRLALVPSDLPAADLSRVVDVPDQLKRGYDAPLPEHLSDPQPARRVKDGG